MRYIKSGFILAICAALGACATPAPVPVQPDPAALTVDQVIRDKGALKLIGPETPVAAPIYGARTTVSFMGDASTLLSNAVKGMGGEWKFVVAGPSPRLPIYVQVSVKDVSFTDFLQNVVDQLGQRADIEINGQSIKLLYRAHD